MGELGVVFFGLGWPYLFDKGYAEEVRCQWWAGGLGLGKGHSLPHHGAGQSEADQCQEVL